MASASFNGYNNFILENYLESILTTKLNAERLFAVDAGLNAEPGMIVKRHRYLSDSGKAEILGRLEGNSKEIEAGYIEENYECVTCQAKTSWADEDFYRDPKLVEDQLKGLAENMIEALENACVTEMDKGRQVIAYDPNELYTENYLYVKLASALSQLKRYNREDIADMAIYCGVDLEPVIRTVLKDDIKYRAEFIRDGAIGQILGMDIITSNLFNDTGKIYILRKGALTYFTKTGLQTEQFRDPDCRRTDEYARKVGIVALTDDRLIIRLEPAHELDVPTLTNTPAVGDTAITGTYATDGVMIKFTHNGAALDTAIVDEGAWSVACDALVADDVLVYYAEDNAGNKSQETSITITA